MITTNDYLNQPTHKRMFLALKNMKLFKEVAKEDLWDREIIVEINGCWYQVRYCDGHSIYVCHFSNCPIIVKHEGFVDEHCYNECSECSDIEFHNIEKFGVLFEILEKISIWVDRDEYYIDGNVIY